MIYAWAMVATSLVLWPLATGWIYGVGAIVLGAVFLVGAHQLERGVAHGRPVKPMRLFHWSIQYLTILFARSRSTRCCTDDATRQPRRRPRRSPSS